MGSATVLAAPHKRDYESAAQATVKKGAGTHIIATLVFN